MGLKKGNNADLLSALGALHNRYSCINAEVTGRERGGDSLSPVWERRKSYLPLREPL